MPCNTGCKSMLKTSVALCRVYNVSSANISDAKWLSTGKESGPRTVEDTNLPIVLTITSNTMIAVIQQVIFNSRKKAKARSIYAFCDPESETLQFSFPLTIVDDLLRNIFFNSDDEDVPVEHVLWEFAQTKRNVLRRGVNTTFQTCRQTFISWTIF
ncbi:hypothetical protein PHMEG_00024184 [Phytophthora megakarya]|uniref:Uncharacterized protein n=1 Tax=Phytophthora megakarya TaxID=4795 RepID=A0A225VF35_9STRA|nr:hypothetical protein PHMEG_00024184 [Phytophthora megakarya]